MASVWWNGNGQLIAQVDTITVTAVAAGGALQATVNNKTIAYTPTGSDTTSSAAQAWQQLLIADGVPPEIAEIAFTVAGNVLTATAATPGTPFTLTAVAVGGSALTQTHTQTNVSPSDVANANNWLRGGVPALPQDGDDFALANSTVPLLWNLDQLPARFNSFRRWQSFTAQVGLPEWNPAGYWEYRPTYLQLNGPALGTLSMILGLDDGAGTGPTRERYKVGSQPTSLVVIDSGAADDAFAVRFLGDSPSNTVRVANTSLGVAMLSGETSALASALVDGGGTLGLGAGVSFGSTSSGAPGSSSQSPSGATVTANGALLFLFCAPPNVVLDQAAQALIQGVGLLYPNITAVGGSLVTYNSGSAITALTLQDASVLDKSADVQPMTIGSATLDADCQVRDPNNCITWLGPATIRGSITTGPLTTGRGRKVQLI